MIGPQDDGWNEPVRQWPDPDKQPHSNIPLSIQRSLEEAKKCFSTKSYRACAVMCGKAVEEICKDKDEKIENLGEGLKLLKEARIIDEKLFEWGEVLRAERNIGAHARDETISDQDASDMLDFATAISEYIYVLDGKYKAYKERKAKKAT